MSLFDCALILAGEEVAKSSPSSAPAPPFPFCGALHPQLPHHLLSKDDLVVAIDGRPGSTAGGHGTGERTGRGIAGDEGHRTPSSSFVLLSFRPPAVHEALCRIAEAAEDVFDDGATLGRSQEEEEEDEDRKALQLRALSVANKALNAAFLSMLASSPSPAQNPAMMVQRGDSTLLVAGLLGKLSRGKGEGAGSSAGGGFSLRSLFSRSGGGHVWSVAFFTLTPLTFLRFKPQDALRAAKKGALMAALPSASINDGEPVALDATNVLVCALKAKGWPLLYSDRTNADAAALSPAKTPRLAPRDQIPLSSIVDVLIDDSLVSPTDEAATLISASTPLAISSSDGVCKLPNPSSGRSIAKLLKKNRPAEGASSSADNRTRSTSSSFFRSSRASNAASVSTAAGSSLFRSRSATLTAGSKESGSRFSFTAEDEHGDGATGDAAQGRAHLASDIVLPHLRQHGSSGPTLRGVVGAAVAASSSGTEAHGPDSSVHVLAAPSTERGAEERSAFGSANVTAVVEVAARDAIDSLFSPSLAPSGFALVLSDGSTRFFEASNALTARLWATSIASAVDNLRVRNFIAEACVSQESASATPFPKLLMATEDGQRALEEAARKMMGGSQEETDAAVEGNTEQQGEGEEGAATDDVLSLPVQAPHRAARLSLNHNITGSAVASTDGSAVSVVMVRGENNSPLPVGGGFAASGAVATASLGDFARASSAATTAIILARVLSAPSPAPTLEPPLRPSAIESAGVSGEEPVFSSAVPLSAGLGPVSPAAGEPEDAFAEPANDSREDEEGSEGQEKGDGSSGKRKELEQEEEEEEEASMSFSLPIMAIGDGKSEKAVAPTRTTAAAAAAAASVPALELSPPGTPKALETAKPVLAPSPRPTSTQAEKGSTESGQTAEANNDDEAEIWPAHKTSGSTGVLGNASFTLESLGQQEGAPAIGDLSLGLTAISNEAPAGTMIRAPTTPPLRPSPPSSPKPVLTTLSAAPSPSLALASSVAAIPQEEGHRVGAQATTNGAFHLSWMFSPSQLLSPSFFSPIPSVSISNTHSGSVAMAVATSALPSVSEAPLPESQPAPSLPAVQEQPKLPSHGPSTSTSSLSMTLPDVAFEGVMADTQKETSAKGGSAGEEGHNIAAAAAPIAAAPPLPPAVQGRKKLIVSRRKPSSSSSSSSGSTASSGSGSNAASSVGSSSTALPSPALSASSAATPLTAAFRRGFGIAGGKSEVKTIRGGEKKGLGSPVPTQDLGLAVPSAVGAVQVPPLPLSPLKTKLKHAPSATPPDVNVVPRMGSRVGASDNISSSSSSSSHRLPPKKAHVRGCTGNNSVLRQPLATLDGASAQSIPARKPAVPRQERVPSAVLKPLQPSATPLLFAARSTSVNLRGSRKNAEGTAIDHEASVPQFARATSASSAKRTAGLHRRTESRASTTSNKVRVQMITADVLKAQDEAAKKTAERKRRAAAKSEEEARESERKAAERKARLQQLEQEIEEAAVDNASRGGSRGPSQRRIPSLPPSASAAGCSHSISSRASSSGGVGHALHCVACRNRPPSLTRYPHSVAEAALKRSIGQPQSYFDVDLGTPGGVGGDERSNRSIPRAANSGRMMNATASFFPVNRVGRLAHLQKPLPYYGDQGTSESPFRLSPNAREAVSAAAKALMAEQQDEGDNDGAASARLPCLPGAASARTTSSHYSRHDLINKGGRGGDDDRDEVDLLKMMCKIERKMRKKGEEEAVSAAAAASSAPVAPPLTGNHKPRKSKTSYLPLQASVIDAPRPVLVMTARTSLTDSNSTNAALAKNLLAASSAGSDDLLAASMHSGSWSRRASALRKSQLLQNELDIVLATQASSLPQESAEAEEALGGAAATPSRSLLVPAAVVEASREEEASPSEQAPDAGAELISPAEIAAALEDQGIGSRSEPHIDSQEAPREDVDADSAAIAEGEVEEEEAEALGERQVRQQPQYYADEAGQADEEQGIYFEAELEEEEAAEAEGVEEAEEQQDLPDIDDDDNDHDHDHEDALDEGARHNEGGGSKPETAKSVAQRLFEECTQLLDEDL